MKNTNYRPDIDGLRAIAIFSVVLFHVGLSCPGGYVGVDIFFVISGYLISSLILKDCRAGRFSLVSFWERRVRRIFPALAVMVVITLIAGWFLLLPEHLEKLGNSAIAQSLLSANIYFWRTTNYFGGTNDEKPLLHTWSLAVEEQFYMFFPLLLMLLFTRSNWRRPRFLIGMLAILWITSFLVAAWGLNQQPYATFFLLPTRAWELICGAIIAALPSNAVPQTRWLREGISVAGLLAMIVPILSYTENTPFPGWAALPPCVGTTLVIWANSPVENTTESRLSWVSRALSQKWVVFIGLISYSLYLWHWPVIMFTNYWRTAPLSLGIRWSLVALSFVMAGLSWRYIETPFRNRSVCASRQQVFSLVGVITCLMLFLGLSFIVAEGFPKRMPDSVLKIMKALKDDSQVPKKYAFANQNMDDISVIENDAISRFGSHDAKLPLSFLVLGDSHAACAIPIFDQLGRDYGIAGVAITYQSTPPLLGWKIHSPRSARDPEQLWLAAVNYAKRNQIKNIFLIAFWSNYQRSAGPIELERALRDTIDCLRTKGFDVWVVLDNPTYANNPVKGMVRKTLFSTFVPEPSTCDENEHKKKNSAMYNLADHLATARFLDPSPYLLDPARRTFIVAKDGFPLYFDHNHLTLRGEELALLPTMQPVFATELQAKQSTKSPAFQLASP